MSVKLKKVYKFSTLAPTILGGEYTNMKVKKIMDSEEAVKLRDIYTLHTTLTPLISGLPDVNDCSYVLFESTVNDTKLVIALEYIDLFSLNEVVQSNIRVEVYDSDSDNISLIRTRFEELGIKNFKITTF